MQRVPLRHCALVVLALAGAIGCGGSSEPATPTAAAAPTPTPAPVSPAVSRAGLVLLLHMDEPAWDGTRDQVRDASGEDHHGTAVAGATTAAGGRFGRAAPQGIAAKRVDFQSASAYAFFLATSDRLSVDVDTEDDRFEAGAPLAGGRWYHAAFVYSGAARAVTVYVNGAAVTGHSESASSITAFPSPMAVGCLPLGSTAQGFVGLLDDVAVWHRALSAGEIAAIANATGPIADR